MNPRPAVESRSVRPADVRDLLSRHMLVDGFHLVIDLQKSSGCKLVGAATGKTYLDFYSFFASSPLGVNHPRLLEPDFTERILPAARNKPANSDVYSVEMATFVKTLERVAMPEHLPYLFLIEGGALGVENALKAAFDWKVRKNFEKGYTRERGTRVLHFREAFHGRSGYTLSLTNTDPVKVAHFPKFDWPRVDNPKIVFPCEGENLEAVERAERRSIAQIERAFAEHPDDIAAIIIEPIQAEGGDNHFRPEFFRELRRLADEHDAMLIFDEVQTGLGLTGKMWAYEHFGVEPDMLCFGKKLQVCGFMASRRIDEVRDNVFHVSSRINSTWGGNLADMVRATAYLEIIESEGLVENAAAMGERLIDGIRRLRQRHPSLVSAVRGRGLMCAFDLPDKGSRDRFRALGWEEGVMLLACGPRSIRFRPPLDVTGDVIDEGIEILERCLDRLAG